MTRLNDKHGKRCFGIEIEGCPYRYYTNQNPLPNPSSNDINRILNVSGFNESITELAGGIVKYNPVTISLAVNKRGDNPYEPHKVFLNTIRHTTIYKALLVSEIPRDEETPSIQVDVEPASLNFPCKIYIGAETFTATGYSNPSAGVWSIACSSRTGFRQYHAIRLDGTDTPYVTGTIINFRGRRAKIYMGYWDVTTNTVVDSTIILNGFIERSPELSDGVVSLSIVPLTALLDNSLGFRNQASYLATGGHLFPSYNKRYMCLAMLIDYGARVAYPSDFYCLAINESNWTTDYWMSTTEMLEMVNFLGRRGGMSFNLSMGLEPKITTNYNGFDGGVGFDITGLLYGTDFKLYRDYALSKNVPNMQWTHFNLDGSIVEVNFFDDNKFLFNTALDLKGSNQPIKQIDLNEGVGQNLPQDIRELYQVPHPIDALSNFTEPVGGIGDGFYLQGEPFITLTNSLDLPSVATQGVSYSFKLTKGDMVYFIKATHETVIGGRNVLWLDLTDYMTSRLPPIVQYVRDADKVKIEPTFSWDESTPSEFLLRLLQSGGGGSINGAYDRDTLGLNLTSADIDIASFLEHENSTSITTYALNSASLDDDITISELISSMLMVMGCIICMKNGLITLKSIQNPSSSELLSINDSDCFLDPPPSTTLDEDIITQYSVKFDYPVTSDGEPKEAIFNDYSAINLLGGEGKKISLELHGLNSKTIGYSNGAIYSFLKPTIARLFRLYGGPILQYELTVYSGLGFDFNAGDLVAVTSSHLLGYDNTWNVESMPCMVKAVNKDLLKEGVALTLITFGVTNFCRINMAAKVFNIPASNQLYFEEAVYSDDDLSWFTVGDKVKIIFASTAVESVELIIASITGLYVTFTTNHGVASTGTGAYMVPTTYPNASAGALALGGFTDASKEYL